MVVGVDVSSRAIHLAWLEDGKPQRWHQELAKGHLIDRLRSIDIHWPTSGPITERINYPHPDPADTTEIAIEAPFSNSRRSTAALAAVVGIVTRQAPPWARVAWPSSGELRAAIGARNTKQDAHRALFNGITDGQYWIRPILSVSDWDEHELDALTACIGWTRILDQQEGAA